MILQKEIKTPIIVCDIYACPYFGARILKWCVLIMGWFYAFSFSKVTWEHKKSYILSPSLTVWLAKGIFWTSSKMSHTKKVWHFKRYCGCFPWSQLLVLLWYFFLHLIPNRDYIKKKIRILRSQFWTRPSFLFHVTHKKTLSQKTVQNHFFNRNFLIFKGRLISR